MGMHVLSPEDAKKEIIECMKVGIAPYLVGNPGIGKSHCVYQIGEEYNLEGLDTCGTGERPTNKRSISKQLYSTYHDLRA